MGDVSELKDKYQLSEGEIKTLVEYAGSVLSTTRIYDLETEHVLALQEEQKEQNQYKSDLSKYKYERSQAGFFKKGSIQKPREPSKNYKADRARTNFEKIQDKYKAFESACSVHRIQARDFLSDVGGRSFKSSFDRVYGWPCSSEIEKGFDSLRIYERIKGMRLIGDSW